MYAKTAEPIEMSFGVLTHMGTGKHVLDGGQGRTNPFSAARSDKMAMRPFVKIGNPLTSCLDMAMHVRSAGCSIYRWRQNRVVTTVS